VPPAIDEIPGMPRPARPLAALEAKPPIPLATPPKPGILLKPLTTPPPSPPRTPPKAVPTPGINAATGATFLTTLPIDLNVFFYQPNSAIPVIGLIDIPSPTVYSLGSSPTAIISFLIISCVCGEITGGTTISPGATWASIVSSPLPKPAIPLPELSILFMLKSFLITF